MRTAALCAGVRIQIRDRKTGSQVASFPAAATSGTAERDLSATSIMTVTVDRVAAAECCQIVRGLQTAYWAYELLAFRADDLEPWWIGPLTGLHETPSSTQVVLTAKDRSIWWSRAPLSGDVNPGGGDVASILVDLAKRSDQFNKSGLNYLFTAAGVPWTTPFLDADDKSHAEHIATLSQSVDWTVAGRVCRVLGKSGAAPRRPIRGKEWVERPQVSIDGMQFATHVVMKGQGVRGQYPAGPISPTSADASRGLHVAVLTGQMTTVEDANAEARRQWLIRNGHPASIITGNTSLGPTWNGDPSIDLVPGDIAQIVPDAACLDAAVLQRLKHVSLEWTAGKETAIRVDWQPMHEVVL